MSLTVRLPYSIGAWIAVIAVVATFAGLLGWGIGLDMGYRQGERAVTRALGPEIDANAAEICALNERIMYLEEWATMETTASYYGGNYHNGRLTASGLPFDENELTAASPWLPFGKRVLVTRIDTGASVIVTVTDRGPAPRLGRGIDLSTAAARAIGMIHDGVVPVKLGPSL